MHTLPPDFPIALAREVFARLDALPPPRDGTPEARAVRDDLAYAAAVEAYYPVDAGEAELAVQIVAANAHALDSLRLAGLPGNSEEDIRRCRAQGNSDDAHRTDRTARPGTPAGLAREGTERDAPSRDGAGSLPVQVRISARGDAATAPGRGGQTGWRPGTARRISKRSSTRGERRGSAPWNAGLRCTNAGDRDRYQPHTARAQSRRIQIPSHRAGASCMQRDNQTHAIRLSAGNAASR